MNLIALNPWHIVDPTTAEQHRFYRQQETDWLPPIDIYEDETGYHLLMDLPGFRKENVDIRIENQQIHINGFRAAATLGTLRHSERVFGKFSRYFSVPENVDQAAINAQFTDGVMVIKLPKLAHALPKKILIEAKN